MPCSWDQLHGICIMYFGRTRSEVCEGGPERTRTTMRTTYDVTVDTTVDRGVPIGTITHESQVTVGTLCRLSVNDLALT